MLFSVVLSQSLLFGYRRLYTELLRQQPAYPDRAGRSQAGEVPPGGSFELLRVAGSRYSEYFNADRLRQSLELEEGQFVDAVPGETQAIWVAFGIDVTEQSPTSGRMPVTKAWQERTVIWCWFVIVLPLLYFGYLAANWRRVRVPHTIVGLCGLVLLLEALVPADSPNPRYLTTLAWLEFLMIGSVGTRLFKRGASPSTYWIFCCVL